MNVFKKVAVWESLKIHLGLLIILWYSIFPLQRRNELLHLLLGIFEASGVDKRLIFYLSCDWEVDFGWVNFVMLEDVVDCENVIFFLIEDRVLSPVFFI
jgi:hypothetical protein